MEELELDIAKLKRSLICEICVGLFGSPFMLSCGHVFCYGCILDWLFHKRTCPTCRHPLSQSPSFAYLVQEMVDVFVHRMEASDPEGEGKHVKKHQEDQRKRMEENRDNLFFDLFVETKFTSVLCDREDGVMRCMRCYWEIEGTVCAHCGFQFSDEEVSSLNDFSYSDLHVASELHDQDSLYQDSICSEPDDYDYDDPFIDDRPTDEIERDLSIEEINDSKDLLEQSFSTLYSDTAEDKGFDEISYDSLIEKHERRSKKSKKRGKNVSLGTQRSISQLILLDSDENVNIHENSSTLSNSRSDLVSFPEKRNEKLRYIDLSSNSSKYQETYPSNSNHDIINEYLSDDFSISSLQKYQFPRKQCSKTRNRCRIINIPSSVNDSDYNE
ncbi:hypothetical protein PNEG_01081 [Pneumocystis murina B123]|uniref:RING-type domain-containing protein n=1 Tax=Pneumocystis murina (strain B123) TaxID=1069680 RepID=M7NUZ2_PNEMU|nr:hypothetical protein PNEG_01081 [Pneumocystis murina B123]EMR10936.1 hypothetical protein PNEG_01081 [Pneumocystis murina B123]